MLRTGTLPSSDALYNVLADWIDEQPMANVFAQQVWESGGFIVPSLSRRLFRSGASINCELWQDGRTALHVAATFWVHDAVQTLLELGADSSKRTANGYNILHWFFVHENVHDELDPTKIGQVNERPPIFRYFYQRSRIKGTIKAIISSVPNKRALLNQTCGRGQTPLMHAVKRYPSSTTAVRVLLEEGSEVDQRDSQGRTAMMHLFGANSFASRCPSILKHLLHFGADPKAVDWSDNSVLSYWARQLTSNELGNLFPGFNSYNQTFRAIANIGPLSQQKCLSEELKGLMIPLVLAARLGNAQMCLALLSTGVNPNDHGIPVGSSLTGNSEIDLDYLEWNPLLVALDSNAYITAALLIENGADVRFKTRQRDGPGSVKHMMATAGVTPLHVLVSSDRPDRPTRYSISKYFVGKNYSGRCIFRPIAQVDDPTSNKQSFRKPENTVRASDGSDDSDDSDLLNDSDPEYETLTMVYGRDRRGCDLTPYDNILNIEGSLPTRDNSFLSTIFKKDATSAQCLEVLVEYMISKGALVDASTSINVTPLLLCINNGLSDVANILLKNGADPNVADIKGYTPLMVAARQGHDAIVECLLLSGAHPDAQLRIKGPDECKCKAILNGKRTYNSCDAPFSALVFAVERGHQRIVELLLRHGADPNMKIVHHVHGQVPLRRPKKNHVGPHSSS
ncbi:ankyrin repeat-containing domain protein, partial [Mariannaea sp. PMI_226]